MSNPSKTKGTRAETALKRWLRDNGFPHADRQPLRGNRDAGDLALCPGVVVEVKAVAKGATGQPPAHLLGSWMSQAEAERVNAGAALCPLVVKRAGTGDPAKWWAYLPLVHVAHLLGGPGFDLIHTTSDPVCMSVHTLTDLLRAAGYGDPLTEETDDD